MKVYQFYQIPTGAKLYHYRLPSKEKAIERWLDHFWQECVGLSEEEAFEWLDDTVGLDLERLGCREYNIEEYICQNKQNLDHMSFFVCSQTEHQAPYSRQFVFSELSLLGIESYESSVKHLGEEECLGYLDELVHAGYDKSTYEYLTEYGTEGLVVEANTLYYGFHAVPAKKWLSWYRYAKDEIIDTTHSQEFNCLFCDERGRFVDYPFPGMDLMADQIKYRKRHQQLGKIS